MIDGLHYFFYDDCIVGASASFRNIVILNENLVILHACVIDYFKIACYNKRKKKRTFDCVKFLFYAIILCCLFCCTFNANAAGLKLISLFAVQRPLSDLLGGIICINTKPYIMHHTAIQIRQISQNKLQTLILTHTYITLIKTHATSTRRIFCTTKLLTTLKKA